MPLMPYLLLATSLAAPAELQAPSAGSGTLMGEAAGHGRAAPAARQVGATAAAPAPGGAGQAFSVRLPASRAHKFEIKSAGGDVRVHAHRAGDALVRGTRTMGRTSCTLEAHADRDGLFVRVADADGAPCRIDVDVALPPGLDVDISGAEGNVFVSGMRRALVLQLGQGSAVVGGTFTAAKVHIEQGSLSAQGLGAHSSIAVDSGNAQLYLLPPSPKSELFLDVGTGNVTLTVPGAPVSLLVSTLQGTRRVDVTESPSAPVRVEGTIRQGNLIVRPAPNGG